MTAVDLAMPEEPDPPRHYRVEIPKAGKEWITENDRPHWRVKAARVALWRDVAAWRSRSLPTFNRAHMICELRFADARRRDPNNWAPTAKAIVDGFVDSRVFPDDNHRHVIGPDMRLGPVVTAARRGVVMHIYPLDTEEH